MSTATDTRRPHSPREAADLLAITTRTVIRLIGTGEIAAFRVGHSWRIPAEEIDRIKRTSTAL